MAEPSYLLPSQLPQASDKKLAELLVVRGERLVWILDSGSTLANKKQATELWEEAVAETKRRL